MLCPNPSYWYAIAVHARREHCVATVLGDLGYENFLPTYPVMRRVCGKVRKAFEPLFPGYLFCRLDGEYRLPVLRVAHVSRIVGDHRGPIPINEDEIASVRRSVAVCPSRQPWPFLQTGERVRMIDGPLQGIEGCLVEFRGESRLLIGIELLQRYLSVEIDRRWVQPVCGVSEGDMAGAFHRGRMV